MSSVSPFSLMLTIGLFCDQNTSPLASRKVPCTIAPFTVLVPVLASFAWIGDCAAHGSRCHLNTRDLKLSAGWLRCASAPEGGGEALQPPHRAAGPASIPDRVRM